MKITFVRWAMTVLEMNSRIIVTDPFFRVLGLFPAPPFGYRIQHMPLPNLVLVSHRHVDHWDPWAMRWLVKRSPEIPLLVRPHRIASEAREMGFKDVRELPPYAHTQVGDLKVTATPASHPGTEVGYLIQGEKTVYFAGDTSYSQRIFTEVGERFDIDVALLPVGGLQAPGGISQMGPEQVLDAIRLLKPKVVVGIHWGGLPSWLPFVQMAGSPTELARLVEAVGLPVQVRGFAPLEAVEL